MTAPPATQPPPSPGPVVPGGVGARGQQSQSNGTTIVNHFHLPTMTDSKNQQDVQVLAYQIGLEINRRTR